jgi:hypothetical protein
MKVVWFEETSHNSVVNDTDRVHDELCYQSQLSRRQYYDLMN